MTHVGRLLGGRLELERYRPSWSTVHESLGRVHHVVWWPPCLGGSSQVERFHPHGLPSDPPVGPTPGGPAYLGDHLKPERLRGTVLVY